MMTADPQLLAVYRRFRAWRRHADIHPPALADHAETVENDLWQLINLDPQLNAPTYGVCVGNIAAFVKAWDRPKAG